MYKYQYVIYNKFLRNLTRFFMTLGLFLFASQSMAVTYTFSDAGVSPALSGCSRTGAGTYLCTSAVTLSGTDSIVVTGTLPALITFNSNLTLNFLDESNSAKINSAGSASNLNIIVAGNVSIGKKVVINANIQAGYVNDYGGDVVFGGSINTTTGNINIGYSSDITGSITSTTGQISLGDQVTVSGSVTSTSGGINFTNTSTISGNVVCSACVFTLSGLPSRINGNVNVAKLLDYVDIYNRGTQYGGSITVTSTSLVDAYLKLGNYSNVAGNVTAISNFANNPYIIIGNSAIVQGNVSATGSVSGADAYVYVYNLASVVGNVSANATTTFEFARVETRTGANIGGSISAIAATPSYGTVYLYSGTVSGSVVSSDSVYNFANVAGCVQSSNPSGADITLYSGSTSGGVCCGDSTNGCTNSCVFNFAGAMPATCSFPATLIANYALDELSWNGTLNEAKDTAGYSGGPFDGQGVGSPVPTASTTSPARAGATGTCGYAAFTGSTTGGSAFTLDGLPVNTATGAKTSVSFWMYWNGTDNSMPICWNKYDLMFSGSHFGFNTDNADIYGISTTGLANGWHHVVAIFTNGNVTTNKIYIDGVNKTLTQRLATPNNTNTVVQSTFQVSGYAKNTNWRFSGGSIDELKVYNGEMLQAQVTADYNATHSCPNYSVVPSSLNCVAVGATGNTGRLYTQLAGTAFNVDVVALKSTGAIETSYVTSGTKNVTLEFVDGTGSTACASRTVLSPTVSQTVSFASSDAGRKTAAVTISKAYRDLRCRVTDANQSPTVVACSSDDFSVRPTDLAITSSNAIADSANGSPGRDENATPIFKAGTDSFNLTATANATGYDGTPTLKTPTGTNNEDVYSWAFGASPLSTDSYLSPATWYRVVGQLTGSFSAANPTTGIALGNTFKYSEVGYFRLKANSIVDTAFTAVDAANGDCTLDYSNSLVGSKYGCYLNNTASYTPFFGRFIPDHFTITPITTTPACSSNFTYFGQDGLTTSFTLTAQNGSNQTTQNYTNNAASEGEIYGKLSLTSPSAFNFTASGLPSGSTITSTIITPTASWIRGQATVTAKHLISRPTAAASPTNITISAVPTDSDGVTMTSTAVSTASPFRYGRLYMPNVYGSELLPLSVPIEAQYWNGSAYLRNQLDSCTAIPASSIAMGSYKGNLAACETVLSGTGTMSSGKTSANLTKPGNGNNGSVDLTLNLTTSSGTTCNSATSTSATNAGITWFGTTNPSARETFGLFKSPVIYMRESY